jgi:hypothetical protein
MSEMNKAIGNQVLLTSDQVRGWQEDLQRWEAKRAEAEVRIADLRRKLEAASFLSGLSFPPPASVTSGEGEHDQESMGDALKRILAELDRPARPSELQVELRKISKFRESLDKNPAYLYTVIARLKVKGDIKKFGKRIRLAHKDEASPEGNPEDASKTVEG